MYTRAKRTHNGQYDSTAITSPSGRFQLCYQAARGHAFAYIADDCSIHGNSAFVERDDAAKMIKSWRKRRDALTIKS